MTCPPLFTTLVMVNQGFYIRANYPCSNYKPPRETSAKAPSYDSYGDNRCNEPYSVVDKYGRETRPFFRCIPVTLRIFPIRPIRFLILVQLGVLLFLVPSTQAVIGAKILFAVVNAIPARHGRVTIRALSHCLPPYVAYGLGRL
jgi:hypothetical protein